MKIIMWGGYFSRWREWPIFQLVGGGIPLITPPPFPQIGHKLENFPWGHQKQVGKFQNLQVYIEYGFLHNALKLDSNAHTKLI